MNHEQLLRELKEKFLNKKVIGVIVFLLLITVVTCSNAQGVDPEPKWVGELTSAGFAFDVKGGERWYCIGDGEGKVDCITENSAKWQCVYQEPQVFFNNCEQQGSI